MPAAILQYCTTKGINVPQAPGEILRLAMESMAQLESLGEASSADKHVLLIPTAAGQI
jgi:hypothetical protein